jgi:hypothetical protein
VGALAEAKLPFVASAAALLFAVLLLLGACGGDTTGQGDGSQGNAGQGNGGRGERGEPEGETMPATSGPETTAEGPPKITLGEEPGGQPEVVLRLEGGPKTTFSGLCSVGDEQSVLDGRVPKRFTFDPRGRELSCRIEKRDRGRGALKIILIAGDTTRSVQQTNSPGGTINLSYSD